MQYNAIANEKQSSEIYGWEDLGIDPRQLILVCVSVACSVP